MNMMKKVIDVIANSENGLTCEEIAYKLTGESKQNVISPVLTKLKNSGTIIGIGKRNTTNGGSAVVYKLKQNDEVNIMDIMTLSNAVEMIRMNIEDNNFKSDVHMSCVMPITAETANYIKENLFNDNNRTVQSKGRNVSEIAAAMREGKFKPTSTLIFDVSGKLIDGHHRITAQCIANVDCVYTVTVGADPEAYATIDTGKRRSTQDTASMAMRELGYTLSSTDVTMVSAIVLHLIAVSKNRACNAVTATSATNTEIQEFVSKAHGAIWKILQFIKAMGNDLPYFKAMLQHGKMKRVVTCRVAQMCCKSFSFTENFLHAVFSGHKHGAIAVGDGTTAGLTYKMLQEMASDDSVERRLHESRVSSLLMNAHNILKADVQNEATKNMFIKRKAKLLIMGETGQPTVPAAI